MILYSKQILQFQNSSTYLFPSLKNEPKSLWAKLYGLSKNQHLKNRSLYGLTAALNDVLSSSKTVQMYKCVHYETVRNSSKIMQVCCWRLPRFLCQDCLEIRAKIYWEMCPLQILEIFESFLTLFKFVFSQTLVFLFFSSLQNSSLWKVNNELSLPCPSPFLFMATSFSI